MNFLKHLFKPQPTPAEETGASQTTLSLQSETQALRLELAERDQRLRALEIELDQIRRRQDEQARELASSRLESLFNDLAAPAAQVMTQSALVEEGRPVNNRDIVAVVRRLLRALERHGLVLEGKPGEQATYDPARHQPMNPAVSPQPGQPVTIRFAAVAYGGKIIYKAIVE